MWRMLSIAAFLIVAAAAAHPEHIDKMLDHNYNKHVSTQGVVYPRKDSDLLAGLENDIERFE